MSEQNPTTVPSGAPLPRYLISREARAVIYAIEETGFSVTLTSPATGSVSLTITAPDGHTRNEFGRAEELEAALRLLAKKCGLELDAE